MQFSFQLFVVCSGLNLDKQSNPLTPLTPVGPNSDQQQFSPNNIHTLSRDKDVI